MNRRSRFWPSTASTRCPAPVLRTAAPFCLLVAICTSSLAEDLSQQPGLESDNSTNSTRPAAVAESVADSPLNPVQPATALPASRVPKPAPAGNPEQMSRPSCLNEKGIRELTTNIDIKAEPGAGTGPETPESIAESCLRSELQAPGARIWTPLCYYWEAPALCYGPLYFEETNLERYGYSQTYLRGVQPLVSSAHFFGTSILLPYLLVAEPPRECVYTLGEYRPGSCVPFQWNYPYFSPTARCPNRGQ